MPRNLPPLPVPPASLHSRKLPVVEVEHAFIRIHRLAHDPAFWGRTGRNRFDAPDAEYGVLYTAETFDGAFIETFGDLVPKILTMTSLAARGMARVSSRRPLRLVDLAGAGLSQLGLDARISVGDHAVSQQWSHAVWKHPRQPDGIWYAARHDSTERAVALFDRAAESVTVAAVCGLVERPIAVTTAAALDKYGFSLLP